MAREPYEAYPTVTPTGPSPVKLDIQSSPADFGSLEAQGMERLAGGLQTTSGNLGQAAFAMQAMNNETAARDASNSFMQSAGQAWAQYGTLQGKAAADAYPQFAESLKALQDQHSNALGNPQAKNDFLNASSYMLNRLTLMASTHAASQQQAYWKQSHVANVENMTNSGVLMQNDPGFVDTAAKSVADSVDQIGQMEGWDGERVKAETSNAVGRYYHTVIASQALNNPQAAAATLARARPMMDGASIAESERLLHGIGNQAAVASAASDFLSGGSSDTGAMPAPGALKGAIRGQEGSGPNAVSPAGAAGTYQVTPGFFQKYALPGENFNNEADREKVAERGIDQLNERYNGDPSRVAVAYFSGEGNVAPAGSPTPWITDKSDGTTSTSSYVHGVLSRLGPQETGGTTTQTPGTAHQPQAFSIEADTMTKLWAYARNKFPDNVQLQRETVGAVWQELQQQNILQAKYEAEQAKATKDAQESAGQTVIKTLMTPGATFDPAVIRDNTALTWEQKEHLWNLAQSHYATADNHDTKTYGPGFWQMYQNVHAPDNDPNRITDPSQLWSHGGPTGDLTLSGIEKLTQEIQGKRTPDGEAEAEMKKQFLSMAKAQITGTNEGMHIRDPKGDELFLKFMAQVLPAYDKAKAAGASATSLLDPSSKDYLGSAIASFRRPMTTWVQDMLQENEPGGVPAATAAPQAAAAPDLTTKEGIIAAYNSGKISRDQASQALVSRGLARPAQPASAPAQAPVVALPGDNAP
jgi:Transglycosylase SLT domain